MENPKLQLVIRTCSSCIYYTEYKDGEQVEGFCHLTPRERAVKPDYFCSHGVWYEWNPYTWCWEPHLHGEVVPPATNPQAPGITSLDDVRELFARRENDPE